MHQLYPELAYQMTNALDIETAYVTMGDPQNPAVVLLHGMTSSADVWRETLHELAADFWLIAPDLPGFGHSAITQPYTLGHLVEWLAALRDELDLAHFHLVGHSFGGALAASYAASYPEDIHRLLLVAPAIVANMAYPDLIKQAAIGIRLVDLSQVVTQSRAMVRQVVKSSYFAPEKLHDSLWERRLLMYDQARASAEVLKALAFQDLVPTAERITDPTLLVWGDADTVVPTVQSAEVERLIPNSQLITMPECGHIPPSEKSAAFVALARAFLQGEDDHEQLTAVVDRVLRPRPIISVFGSSAPQVGQPEYEEARELGRLLAQAGCAVATGGYMGTMEAVSRGASEAGGTAVGVTSDQIEQFRPIGPNPFITDEVRYATLRDRLLHLVEQNDGIVVLPGGIGTLSEMSLAWSFLQTGEMGSRPFVLLGQMWPAMMETFVAGGHVRELHQTLLTFAATPAEAVAALQVVLQPSATL